METVLTEITTIRSRRTRKHLVIGWLKMSRHASTSWKRCSGYVTPSGFGSLGLKTASDRFVVFGPKKPREDLGATRDVIRELSSRQSDFMKGLYGNQFGPFCSCGHLQNILDKVCAKCSIRLIKFFLFLLWFELLKFRQSVEPPPEDAKPPRGRTSSCIHRSSTTTGPKVFL